VNDVHLINDNQRLSTEERNLKADLDGIVYANQPTAAYFKQFNTNIKIKS
jgi:hypothetical protein